MDMARMVRTWILVTGAQYFAFTAGPAQALSLLGRSFLNWNFSGFSEQLTAVMSSACVGALAGASVSAACSIRIWYVWAGL